MPATRTEESGGVPGAAGATLEQLPAALGQMLGPALRKTTTLALSVTTFNMAAYWFKTIWLPTYLLQTRSLKPGEVAWLLLMDQIGSVAGYVAFGFCST